MSPQARQPQLTPRNCRGATLLAGTATSAASLRTSGAVRSSIRVTAPWKIRPSASSPDSVGRRAGIGRHMRIGQEEVGAALPEHQPTVPVSPSLATTRLPPRIGEADRLAPADLADIGRHQPLARTVRVAQADAFRDLPRARRPALFFLLT